MQRDEKTLKRITDRTMHKLIGEEIVLPSRYLETFVEEGASVQKETLPADTSQSVEAYQAVEKQLFGSPETHAQIRSEMAMLREQLYADVSTGAKNRLWIFKEKLDPAQHFKDAGHVISLKITDYKAIVRDYDMTIGDRLQTLVHDFVAGYLKQHHLGFEIARYQRGHFLIFLHELDDKEVDGQLANMKNEGLKRTFKHQNRLFGLTFDAVAVRYISNEPFASVMDQLEEKRFERGFATGGTAGRT